MAARYPAGLYRIHAGLLPLYVIHGKELTGLVLTTQLRDFDKTEQLMAAGLPLFGRGLLTSNHQTQHQHRPILQPSFNHATLPSYAEMMNNVVRDHVAAIVPGMLDFSSFSLQLTMDVVGRVLLDVDVRTDAAALGRGVAAAVNYLTLQFIQPLRTTLSPKLRYDFRTAVASLNATIMSLIEERRQAVATGTASNDLMTMLVQANLAPQVIRDEVMTAFLAGHETVALALSWTMSLLTSHPGYYARLQAEVDEVLQGRTPKMEDMVRLVYTQSVIKETLRLYPPAHTAVRMTTMPTSLGAYQLPAGAVVMLDFYAMHHRADYFPQPEQFDPDRWQPGHEKLMSKGAYLPFGAGPRTCIGMGFANLELTIALVHLIQRWHFTTANQVPAARSLVTLQPRRPISVHATLRLLVAHTSSIKYNMTTFMVAV